MAIGASKPEEPVFEAQTETQMMTVHASGGNASSGNRKVATPRGLFALRIVQLIVAIIVIGLTSYLISSDYGLTFSAESLTMFVAVVTVLAEIYYIVAETVAPTVHNYIAILTLDSLLTIFWLSAMSDSAALRSAFDITVGDYIYYKKRGIQTHVDTYLAILTTDVVVAALELVLFVTSLIMFSVAVHRHLKAAATNPSPVEIEIVHQQAVAHSVV